MCNQKNASFEKKIHAYTSDYFCLMSVLRWNKMLEKLKRLDKNWFQIQNFTRSPI